MTRLEPADKIEGIVGAPRQPTWHLGRAVSAEQRVYILHSAECLASGIDLRKCEYSRALDLGIDLDVWGPMQDRPVSLVIDGDEGDLVPVLVIEEPVQRWKWTCEECGATGPMPDDVLATPHDCKSRRPFDQVARLRVERETAP